jgi:RDD family protein
MHSSPPTRDGDRLSDLRFTLSYFAVMASEVKGGQTIGQRLVHIQVVNRDGTLVTLSGSTARYLMLLVPFILTSEILPPRTPYTIVTSFDTVISVTGLAIVYLYLFNRRTRQSLHDLATHTFVVDAPKGGNVEADAFWRWHWAIPILVVAIAAVSIEGGLSRLMRTPTFSELSSVNQAVLQAPNVKSSTVILRTNISANGDHTTGILVSLTCKRKPTDYDGAGKELQHSSWPQTPTAKIGISSPSFSSRALRLVSPVLHVAMASVTVQKTGRGCEEPPRALADVSVP